MGESLEPKKLALIRILHILEQYTDCDHPLTHGEIVKKLYSDYGIAVERKAIGKNISLLKEAGYDIATDKSGSYLASRTFEDAELRLLADGVLSSRHISSTYSKQLIEKLSTLSNKYFKPQIKSVYSVNDWDKSQNVALFYNIEVIAAAAESGHKIEFVYNKYGADKKLHKHSEHTVSPYQTILHNQRYYLVGFAEKWQHVSHFRLDKITDIRQTDELAVPLRSLDGYKNGLDYKKYSTALPYMFSDEPQQIKFYIANESMIDQIVDWFGYDFRVENRDGRLLVTVKASPNAMEYWLMQYLNNVEVTEPAELRERIITNLKNALEKYSGE